MGGDMTRVLTIGILAGISAALLSGPALAGIRADLKSCTAASGVKSANACTRVLKSGRLPKKQHYIGYYNRGWAYRNAGDLKKALRDFKTASRYYRGYADTHYSLAIVYFDLGQKDKAVWSLEDYVKYKKDKPF